ncbi:hypothetical protein OUZ56_021833 [Daphnia magna]|uniref:Uncharacterized protein n=1 Tax=Daphnia magna TaxID=35525 RepID=A0ABR0AUP7_9CRUS|nr:hypothetical protein OUZ56_021833 [Daphnia magna]
MSCSYYANGLTFIYLVETKSHQNNLEVLGAYKGISSESQQAIRDGRVRELFMAIALATQVLLMKAKVSPSQALSESPDKPMDYYNNFSLWFLLTSFHFDPEEAHQAFIEFVMTNNHAFTIGGETAIQRFINKLQPLYKTF